MMPTRYCSLSSVKSATKVAYASKRSTIAVGECGHSARSSVRVTGSTAATR